MTLLRITPTTAKSSHFRRLKMIIFVNVFVKKSDYSTNNMLWYIIKKAHSNN